MTVIPLRLQTHSQKVCSLYKRGVRNLEWWCATRLEFRYHAVILRERFDKNAKIKDLRVAKDLLNKGEQELWKCEHYQPLQFPNSPGGVAYGREVTPPDWVLDYWHPIEKAMYPKYFARREERKKEYIAWYNKTYPDAPKKFDH